MGVAGARFLSYFDAPKVVEEIDGVLADSAYGLISYLRGLICGWAAAPSGLWVDARIYEELEFTHLILRNKQTAGSPTFFKQHA